MRIDVDLGSNQQPVASPDDGELITMHRVPLKRPSQEVRLPSFPPFFESFPYNFISLIFYLLIYLSIYLFIYLFIYYFIYLFIYLLFIY